MTSSHSSLSRDSLNIPVLGPAIPRRWGGWVSKLMRGILRVLGWRFAGNVPDLPKMVLIGAPHTSNWDFVLAMVAIFSVEVRIFWLGKHTFVNSPLKPLLIWLGGVAVDRRAASGVVEQTAVQFRQREQFLLGLAPEGTRKLVRRWKMGFYYIAQAAEVPILPVSLDYGRKLITIGPPVWPEAGEASVLAHLQTFYQDVQAKIPEKFSLDALKGLSDSSEN